MPCLCCLSCPRTVWDFPVKQLGDARWFHKSFLVKALRAHGRSGAGGGSENETSASGDTSCFMDLPSHIEKFTVPGAHALSRQILDRWLDNESDDYSPYVSALSTVDDVELDRDGEFKYTLMRATDSSGSSKLIVRGSSRHQYHMEIFNDAQAKLQKLGVVLEPLGGGWIEKSQDIIYISGISYAYGGADHSVSAEVIKRGIPLVDIVVDM